MSTPTGKDLEALLDQVFASIPLLFVKEFLRAQKKKTKSIRIGITVKEVRSNLRDAVLTALISVSQIETWLNTIEGWGRQHLYLTRVPKRSLTHAHLLTTQHLTTFVAKKAMIEGPTSVVEPSSHFLADIAVDDELARLTWRVFGSDWERHEELDRAEEIDEEEYEFRAYRRLLKRSASQLIIRKTDGVILLLIDAPLGDDHDSLKNQISAAAATVLAPLVPAPLDLAPVVRGLDTGAVQQFGPKPKRKLQMGVAPTQARNRAEGARVEFKSTREATGYTESDPVRRVRNAMQIERFVGEAGRFRLTFEGKDRRGHDMVVSFHVIENRIYLFSHMDETEVLALVDVVLAM